MTGSFHYCTALPRVGESEILERPKMTILVDDDVQHDDKKRSKAEEGERVCSKISILTIGDTPRYNSFN